MALSRKKRWILGIIIGLISLFGIVVVTAVLCLDSLIRRAMIGRVERETGMRTTIGSVHVGIRSGTVTIKDFRLYNPPDFGTNICLDMPELHIECDANALASNEIHLKLLRINLAKIVVVQDKNGRSNFSSLEKKTGASTNTATHELEARGLKFAGIGTLDLSLGTLEMTNLSNGTATEVPFGIHHQIMHNVRNEGDIAVLGLMMALRGGSSSTNGFNWGNLFNGLKFP